MGRTVMFEIPEQYLCTKDGINVCIDGLVYYRVINANDFIQSTAHPAVYTKNLTQVVLRRAIMTRTVDQIFDSEERDDIEEEMQHKLNEKNRLEDVKLQIDEKRAKSKAHIKVVSAEAELKASKNLAMAAEVFKKDETALQLRYLETLNSISDKNHSSIVFPLQFDLMKVFKHDPKD